MATPALTHPWNAGSTPPRLRITFPSTAEVAELQDWIDDIDRFYRAADEPFAWIIDLRAVESASAQHRKIIAEHHERNARTLRRYCAGMAYVVEGAVRQGLVTAFFWVVPPVYPHVAVRSLEEAQRWCDAQLALWAARVRAEAR